MTGQAAKRLAIELFVVAAAGFVLGLFGPFGSYAAPLALRLAWWVGLLVVGYALFRPLILVAGWLSDHFAIATWLAIGLALTLAALPMTFVVSAAYAGFNWRAALRGEGFVETYLSVWLVGFLVNGLFHLLARGTAPTPAGAEPHGAAAPVAEEDRSGAAPLPPFHDRLPPGFGPVRALAGEDHYVRAIGEGREVLVLVRLRDAEAELAGADGLRVHRSWWVAREAVAGSRRSGRATLLVLDDGREVPVAPARLPALRAAGWPGL